MIPKILHCCWFGGTKPKLARKCRASWERFASDWEIREWNEAKAEALKDLPGYGFFRQAIDAEKWAMASDWLRMAALWKEGGVYLDCDVELVGEIDGLCARGEWVASEWISNDGVWMNPGGGMALEHGSAIAKSMLEEYANLPFDANRKMMPWINERLRSKVEGEGVEVLPPEVMSPIDVHGKLHCTDRTVGIHHYAMSWCGPWRKALQWISWHGGRGLVDLAVRIKRKIFMRGE